MHPNLQVKVFQHERREWTDAQLRDVGPGQEFIALNRLFRVLRPEVYSENVLLDVSKIPEADRPYDPARWRVPKSHDVVYAFGEDGQPTGHQLLANLNPGQRCVFQGLIYNIKAGPSPGTSTLVGEGEVEHRPADPLYVWLEYTIQDLLGKAEVSYRYPFGQLIPLASGELVSVEVMTPGMVFMLEFGGVATVTQVSQPKRWQPNRVFRDPHGNGFRRVVGTYQFTGWVQLMTMTVGGEVHEVTPGHRYWSVTRQGWHSIGSFVVGELLQTVEKLPIRIEAMTPPRWVHETVYNVEVDEHHTYFVGRGKTAVWVHNGTGEGCRVPRAAREEALKTGAISRTTRARAGVAKPPDHHIFPQELRSEFAKRGFTDIDRYKVRLTQGVHEALHYKQATDTLKGGFWNNEFARRMSAQEAIGGQLNRREILRIGAQMRREYISGARLLPVGG